MIDPELFEKKTNRDWIQFQYAIMIQQTIEKQSRYNSIRRNWSKRKIDNFCITTAKSIIPENQEFLGDSNLLKQAAKDSWLRITDCCARCEHNCLEKLNDQTYLFNILRDDEYARFSDKTEELFSVIDELEAPFKEHYDEPNNAVNLLEKVKIEIMDKEEEKKALMNEIRTNLQKYPCIAAVVTAHNT
ncbi:hypothetical protein FACS1894184_15810 [Clostridia bacterium]|nr:hypothetical protein FACS1894184_15810 [Clostridia bacterium]